MRKTLLFILLLLSCSVQGKAVEAYFPSFKNLESITNVIKTASKINSLDLGYAPVRIHNAEGYVDKQNKYRKDHLGNNAVVCDANGNVVQETYYHPYGKPIASRGSGANVQTYKYNGKEQETMMGLEQYDFTARTLDYTYGGDFTSIDPLAENFYRWSPYMAMGGNPVRYNDPTGMEIDSLSQKQWDKEKSRITNRLERLENRNKNGRYDDRIASLNNTLIVMQTAEQSTQLYSLSKVSGNRGGVRLNTDTKAINITYNGTANFVHELTHVEQFESRWGHIGFDAGTGQVVGQDIYDEVQAYRAQFAYDPSSTGVSSMQQILPAWVQGLDGGSLYVPVGHPNYIQGVSANTAISPIYLNSIKADIISGYPNYPGFRNLPDNYILKTSYPNLYYKRR